MHLLCILQKLNQILLHRYNESHNQNPIHQQQDSLTSSIWDNVIRLKYPQFYITKVVSKFANDFYSQHIATDGPASLDHYRIIIPPHLKEKFIEAFEEEFMQLGGAFHGKLYLRKRSQHPHTTHELAEDCSKLCLTFDPNDNAPKHNSLRKHSGNIMSFSSATKADLDMNLSDAGAPLELENQQTELHAQVNIPKDVLEALERSKLPTVNAPARHETSRAPSQNYHHQFYNTYSPYPPPPQNYPPYDYRYHDPYAHQPAMQAVTQPQPIIWHQLILQRITGFTPSDMTADHAVEFLFRKRGRFHVHNKFNLVILPNEQRDYVASFEQRFQLQKQPDK